MTRAVRPVPLHPPGGVRLSGLAAAAVLTALVWGHFAGPAWGHANFERSDPPANTVIPRAPSRLQLWFTEPLEPGFSEVRVLDSQSRLVDRGDSRIAPGERTSLVVSLGPTAPGIYTVAWKALSALDGHVTRGTFSLLIGVEAPPAAAPPPAEAYPHMPAEAAVRWLGHLAAAALVGTLLFWPLVLTPVARSQDVRDRIVPAVQTRARRLLWIPWGLLVATTAAALLVQAAALGGNSLPSLVRTLPPLTLHTRSGNLWFLRNFLLLAVMPVLLAMVRRPAAHSWWLGAALGGGVLLTSSLNSHSAATGSALAVAADWLHQAAVAVWVGGLLNLVFLLPPGLASLRPTERWQFLAALIPRFSAVAVLSVAALIVSGLYLTWVHVGSVAAALETLYGRSLLTKWLLVAPLLFLGAVNLLVIRPRLAAAVAHRRGGPWARGLSRRFARVVLAEAVLATAVLLVTGVLTSLSPARETYGRLLASRPLTMRAQAQDLRVTLSMVPARPGTNTFTLTVVDARGERVTTAERVDLRFTYLDQPLGVTIVRATPRDGAYAVQSAAVGLEGRWQVEMVVRRTGREDARTAFRFIVTAGTAVEEAPPATRQPSLAFRLSRGLGFAALLTGMSGAAYVLWRIGLRSRRGLVLATISLGAILLGAAGAFVVSRPSAESFSSITSPFPPTQESLTVGERIYRMHCQVCHGSEGRGDGPAAATLSTRPADLRVHMAAGHTDGQLFFWVTNGMSGLPMPAFKDRLTDEERWHVINFIKTFGQSVSE